MTKSRFDKLLPARAKAEPTKPGRVETTETRQITVTRAVGKRSKDEYTQVSAYIPKITHKRVKAALVDDDRDFSELVSDLLSAWLNTQKGE